MDFAEAWNHTCSSVSQAVRMGNVEVLKRLIEEGRPLDVQDNRGWRALHEAAANSQLDCLNELLKHDVDVDWRNFENQTALFLGCQKGNPEVVNKLLERGANPNIANNEGNTTLNAAIEAKSFDCVKLLLEHNVNVDHCDPIIWSGVHHASELGLIDILKLLSEHNANLNSNQDPYKRTPIFIAAENGKLNCLQFLIEKMTASADLVVNQTAQDGMTPLAIAGQKGHFDCVECLLEHGADANQRIPGYFALALHYSVISKVPRCFEALFKATDFNLLINKEIFSILHLALERKNFPAVSFLLENNFPIDLVELTCDAGPVDDALLVKFVLRNDLISLNVTALGYAARHLNVKAVDLLLKAGASPDPVEDCVPPLVAALFSGRVAILQHLVENGSNVNYSLCNGVPMAATVAVNFRNWKQFRMLLEWGSQNFSFQEDKEGDFLWKATENPDVMMKFLLIVYDFERYGKWQEMYTAAKQRFAEDQELDPKLVEIASTPPSLQHISRISIRRQLMGSKPSFQKSDVFELYEKKYIPHTIQQFLLHE